MFGRRENQQSSVNVGPAKMVKEIQDAFPGSTCNMDVLTRELIVSANVNNELLLGVALPYNFPAAPPVVTLLDAIGKYLPGLDCMGATGLLDAKTGQIFYHECFAWTPEMTGATMLFLIAVVIKTANKVANLKPVITLPAIEAQGVIQPVPVS